MHCRHLDPGIQPAYLARAIRYEPTSSLPVEAALPGVLAPPIRHSMITFCGHTEGVWSAVLSPDGLGNWLRLAAIQPANHLFPFPF